MTVELSAPLEFRTPKDECFHVMYLRLLDF